MAGNSIWERLSISSVRNLGLPIPRLAPSSMPTECCLPLQCGGMAFAATTKNGGTSRCETNRFRIPISTSRCVDFRVIANAENREVKLQAQIKLLDQVIVVEFFGGAAFERDLAEDNDIAAIGNADGLIEVLFRHQHGERVALLHFGDSIDSAPDENGRKPNGRLVDQEDLRRQHECAAQ